MLCGLCKNDLRLFLKKVCHSTAYFNNPEFKSYLQQHNLSSRINSKTLLNDVRWYDTTIVTHHFKYHCTSWKLRASNVSAHNHLSVPMLVILSWMCFSLIRDLKHVMFVRVFNLLSNRLARIKRSSCIFEPSVRFSSNIYDLY